VAWNCIAVLGTAIIAHARNGHIFVYSMLKRRKHAEMMQITLDKPEMLVECPPCGYRSLFVTPNKVFCLLPNGRVLVCY